MADSIENKLGELKEVAEKMFGVIPTGTYVERRGCGLNPKDCGFRGHLVGTRNRGVFPTCISHLKNGSNREIVTLIDLNGYVVTRQQDIVFCSVKNGEEAKNEDSDPLLRNLAKYLPKLTSNFQHLTPRFDFLFSNPYFQ